MDEEELLLEMAMVGDEAGLEIRLEYLDVTVDTVVYVVNLEVPLSEM